MSTGWAHRAHGQEQQFKSRHCYCPKMTPLGRGHSRASLAGVRKSCCSIRAGAFSRIPALISSYSLSMGLNLGSGTALCPPCQGGDGLGRAQENPGHGFSQQKYSSELAGNHLSATSLIPSDQTCGSQTWCSIRGQGSPSRSQHPCAQPS